MSEPIGNVAGRRARAGLRGEAEMSRRRFATCARPGCPEITDSTYCAGCARRREHERPSRQERGYDAAYDAQRKRDLQLLTTGQVLTCWRCGEVILPHDYSLGHCDDDRSIIHGPEHLARCNLANTRGGCPHESHISPGAYPGGGGTLIGLI